MTVSSRETFKTRWITHGHSKGGKISPTYRSWQMMIARCTYPNNTAFPRYGGRGITVCDRWLESFENFLADMGERPEGKTLDRIDGTKGYELENCRWATASEQCRNRKTSRTVIRSDGARFNTIVEAAESVGGSRKTLRDACIGRQSSYKGFAWRFAE